MSEKIKNTARALAVRSVTALENWKYLHFLVCRDARIAAACSQIELTEEEKGWMHFPSDIYQFRLYKKVWGKLQYGYISDAYYQLKILPKLHKMDYILNRERHDGNLFLDKNYFDLLLTHLKTPETILRNVEDSFLDAAYMPVADADALLAPYEELVFKKSLASCKGEGVRLVKRADYRKVMQEFQENYVVQVRIRQSESFAVWNASSVNHVRITTLNWKGVIYVLGGIFQIGAPGSFLDHVPSENGEHRWIIGIREDGTLSDRVLEPDLVEIYSDFRGKKVNGRIDRYQEMIDLVKKEHQHFPHHKIIGWDLTLDDKNDIICIEYNAFTPGIIKQQYLLGPVFAQRSVRGVPLLQEIMGE